MNGWLILDKPVGPSSTQALGAVKRVLREGGYPRQKIGHGGTLDPLASGVLPIALGEATKVTGRMLDADKVYVFTIGFGVETDTLDGEGQVVATSSHIPAFGAIEDVLVDFIGDIEQVPPAYSALKIDGKRAYDLARSGSAPEMKPRTVRIHDILYLAEGVDASGMQYATLEAAVSKGTYIRSLARDIALALDTVGHVTMLQRTKAGPFMLESAISLDNLAQAAKGRTLEQHLLPLTAGLDDIPALTVSPDQARALRQGRTLAGIAAKPGLLLATDADGPVALVELREGELRVVRGFNL